MDRVCDLLINARSFLQGEGSWVANIRNDGNGGRCALGLLDAARGEADCYFAWDGSDPTYEAAVQALAAGVPTPEKYQPFQCHNLAQDQARLVASYNNNTDYETVCGWFDRTIRVRKLAQAPELEFAVAD